MEIRENNKIRCALCLEACTTENKIDENTTEMMALLLLKLVNPKEGSSMCYKCACNIRICYKLKSACLRLENNISVLRKMDNDVELDTFFVTKRESGQMDTARHLSSTICHFCKKIDSCISYITLEDDKDNVHLRILMNKYLPELSQHIVEILSICATCKISLETFFTVMSNWSRAGKYTEEGNGKINKVPEFNIDSDLIPLCEAYQKNMEECSKSDDIFCESDEDETKFNPDNLSTESLRSMKSDEQQLNIKEEEAEFKLEIDNYIEQEDLALTPFHMENTKINGNKCGCDGSEYKAECVSSKKSIVIHKEPPKYSWFHCNECQYRSKCKRYLKRHMAIHQDGSEVVHYPCDKCGYKTKRKDHLKGHMTIHEDYYEVVHYQCDKCDFKTKQKCHLKRHTMIHQNPSEVVHYQCDKCDFKTKYKSNLNKHMVIKHVPSEVFFYQCDACDFKTKLRGSLKTHIMIHQDPSEVVHYQCDKCDFKTKYKCALSKHIIIKHEISEVYYQCDNCDFKTKRRGSLKKHIMMHKDPSEVVDYQCDKCDFKTKQKSYLKIHMKIHQDPSKLLHYQCDKCDFKTKYKSSLNTHMVIKHGVSEVVNYQCDKCDYNAKQKSNLKRHVMIHEDFSDVVHYQCYKCNYKTKRKDNLKTHIMIH